jgi:hypothetical protein
MMAFVVRKKSLAFCLRSYILLLILMSMMSSIIVNAYDCKVVGCPHEYRCMANGECTPLSVKEYCEDHGKPLYIYDASLFSRNCSDIINEKEEKLCKQCQGDYELQKTVSDIEAIIFGIAAGLAILMISVNGVRLITSKDAKERGNAKRGIAYVILALTVIVMATKFMEYLLV